MRIRACFAWLVLIACAAHAAAAARIEARSADLLVVALVQGDEMRINVSRLLDNAPVHDATVAVVLRGETIPALANVDGSYSAKSGDLALPGDSAVQFRITRGGAEQTLAGTLQVAAAGEKPDDSGHSRQLYWWVLNFAVCGAFLWLWARRRKPPEES